ncbi:hypothetical protein GQ53DRAFT_767615 [Thozetella sp. PMI_491]|nr:hypothetical protein GQ53DRAFT_767615 [Thozetella sp. PMI_491]
MTFLFAATLFCVQLAAAGVPGVATPSPVMPGFPNNCNSFLFIRPGDICADLQKDHDISLDDFLRFNPYINSPDDCPSKLYANYFYCRATVGAHAPPALTGHPQSTAPGKTDSPLAATNPPQPVTTPEPPLTTAAPPPHPTSCEVHNACYRAFLAVHPVLAPSQSSWCTSVLATIVTETLWAGFKDAPLMVTSACPTVFPSLPAAEVITSYCACLTAGQFGDQAHPTGHGSQQNKRNARAFWS